MMKGITAIAVGAFAVTVVVSNYEHRRAAHAPAPVEQVAPAPAPLPPVVAAPAPPPLPPLAPGKVANTLNGSPAPAPAAAPPVIVKPVKPAPAAPAAPAAPKPRPISSLKPPPPPAAPKPAGWGETLFGHPVDRQSTIR